MDIKDRKIDPNKLISYIRSKNKNNKIILGSFNKKLLKKINKEEGILINYHCFSPFLSIRRAKELDADWINPLPYLITNKKIEKIKNNGFKFVPAGNENYKKQMKYLKLGAHALSIHDIKKINNFLQNNL